MIASTASARPSTPATSIPSTSAASRARSRGTTSRGISARRAPSATAKTPGASRNSPPKDSSPNTATSVSGAGRNLLAGGEHRQRQRRVEPRACLAQRRRRQVRSYSALRKLEPGILYRRADPLTRLAHRRIAQSHDRERRQTGADVDLDGDAAWLDAVDREGGDTGQHRLDRRGLIRDGSATPCASCAGFDRGRNRHEAITERDELVTYRAPSVERHERRDKARGDRDRGPVTGGAPGSAPRVSNSPRSISQTRLQDRGTQLQDALGRAGHHRVEGPHNRVLRGEDPRGRARPRRHRPRGPGSARVGAPSQAPKIRRMAASWLVERRERPRADELRFDAIGVAVDATGALLRLDHLEGAF